MERGVEPAGLWEDSPATLKFFRGVYADFVEQGQWETEMGTETASGPRLTRNSVIYENLHIAATDPICTFLSSRRCSMRLTKSFARMDFSPGLVDVSLTARAKRVIRT